MNIASIHKNVRQTNGRVPMSMAGTEDRTVTMTVTPETARRWLGQNTASNRNISKRTVEAYAREMTAGNWKLTHQGIAFNQSGELVDGQHRLHAIVLANVPVTFKVTTGLALEYNSPIDFGYGRSAAHITGWSARYISILRASVSLELGMSGVSFKTSLGQIEEADRVHGVTVKRAVELTASSSKIPTGVVAAVAFAYPLDPDKVAAFAEQLHTGEMLKRGMPALALRKWLQSDKRPSIREQLVATLSAVKAVLQGKDMTAIYSRGSTGPNVEREGMTNYAWICSRRRKLGIEGTPTFEMTGAKPRTEEE